MSTDNMLSKRLTIVAFLAAAWCCTSDAQTLYNIACPGVNIELQCPVGQAIEVLAMQDGPALSVDCTVTNKSAAVTPQTCLHPSILPWAKFICDKMEKCRLPKTEEEMFLCEDTDSNFIQTTYTCNSKRADVQTDVTCENSDAVLKCDKGVIQIVKASYGRLDKTTCTTTPSIMTFCSSGTANNLVKAQCNNKTECRIPVNTNNLGTPNPKTCDLSPKYLTVDYYCQ